MKSLSKRSTLLASLAVVTIVAIGSFTYWQYTPEVDIQSSSAPVQIINMTSGKATPLTTQVKNPSGITYLSDSDTYLISTDNRVVAEVSSDDDSTVESAC